MRRKLSAVYAMDETIEKLRASYDATAYESIPYRQTHPDRLAVVAALQGIAAPPFEGCRVLELGCASGGNLIPMSEQLPHAQFLGVDLSSRQIETGAAIAGELGLANIELRCLDMMDFPPALGHFDYIIAHGVLSWVPRPVQTRLFEIVRDHLSPGGLAYISYNCYPGWRLMEIGREMMLYVGGNTADPKVSAGRGREIIRLVAAHPPNQSHYRETMRTLQKSLVNESDRQILHDRMEVVNLPLYFWQFMQDCKAHGLGYVGDAWATVDPSVDLSKPALEIISKISTDALDAEQYSDFFDNRMFRSSVICHEQLISAPRSPAPGRFAKLYFAGNPPQTPAGLDAEGRAAFDFACGDFKVRVSDPRPLAVLGRLKAAAPAPVSFEELRKAVHQQVPGYFDSPEPIEALERLIQTYHRMGMIELWSNAPDFLTFKVEEFPRTTRYARWQASHNLPVASLKLTAVDLDAAFRILVSLLDGTRNRRSMMEEIMRRKDSPDFASWPLRNRKEFEEALEKALKIIASNCLLLHSNPAVSASTGV